MQHDEAWFTTMDDKFLNLRTHKGDITDRLHSDF